MMSTTESLGGGWIGTALRLPVALAVILGVLLIRPTGLFGRAEARRV